MSVVSQIKDLREKIPQIREATVLDSRISGNLIEVQVRYAPSEKEAWAELVHGPSGSSGATVRVPESGDSVLMGRIDGDPERAFVLGWLSDESTPVPESVESGSTYVHASEGEDVHVFAGDGETKISVKDGGETVVKSSDVRVESDNSTIEAKKAVVDSDDIRLGGEQPSDKEALASPTNAEFKANTTWANSHAHTYIFPLIPIPGPPIPTTPPVTPKPSPPDVSSSKVRSD